MLSILVPVYNYDVNLLVRELRRQCDNAGIEYEIFLCDDASHESARRINETVSTSGNVRFRQLEKNVGRARIRNMMAAEAQYENLLFMDCDSEVVKEDYIKTYLAYC